MVCTCLSMYVFMCVYCNVFQQIWLYSFPVPAMVCCPSCPRLCSRSSAYTLALGLGFVTLGTSRILLLKMSANAGNCLPINARKLFHRGMQRFI